MILQQYPGARTLSPPGPADRRVPSSLSSCDRRGRPAYPATPYTKNMSMQKPWISALIFLTLLWAGGCRKHKTYPRIAPPHWGVDSSGRYPASMTAVIRLPDDLAAAAQAADELGAFAAEECRGLGVPVAVGGEQVFFLLIHGSASETTSLSFRYYAAGTGHLYTTGDVLTFTVDGNYGVADGPVLLKLQPAP